MVRNLSVSSWCMRSIFAAGLILLATVAGVARRSRPSASGTQIVPVYATVIDTQGRLVPSLEQDDFTILDNGKPQEITFFQNDVTPFTVVVMMDYSASMTANLELLEAAAEQFLLRMLPAGQGAGRRLQRQDPVQRQVHQRSRRSDRRAQRPAVRQPDAALGRGRREHGGAQERRRTQGRAGLHRRRRHGEPPGHGRRARPRARRRSDDLRHRPASRSSSTASAWCARARTAACGGSPRKPAAATSS